MTDPFDYEPVPLKIVGTAKVKYRMLSRIRPQRKPLAMDEKEKLLNVMQRTAGLFGNRGWPFAEVLTDDDECKTYPLTDEHAAVIAVLRKTLHEYGREPIKPEPMGS